MNDIKYKLNGQVVRTVTINNSSLVADYRRYLGPDLPQFQSSMPDWNSLIAKVIESIEGVYIRNGGPLVQAIGDPILQTSMVATTDATLIFVPIEAGVADEIVINYLGEEMTIDLVTGLNAYSTRLALAVYYSNGDTKFMNIFQATDDMLIELKNAFSSEYYSILNASKFNHLPKLIKDVHGVSDKLIYGKYLNEVVCMAESELSLDIENSFIQNFKAHEVK